MKLFTITLLSLVFFTCKPTSGINMKDSAGSGNGDDSIVAAQAELLKQYALCECLRQANLENDAMKKDVSLSMYYDRLLYDDEAINMIDTFSKKFAATIMPLEYVDYRGDKAILYNCMRYYKSSSLDSLVRSLESRIAK